jgi:general secretion pathway protein J
MTGEYEAPGGDTSAQAGFTLVELLVALALFSLLVTLLFDNVRAGLLAWHRGSAYAEDLGRSVHVQDALSRLIGNIYPMAVTDGAGITRLQFEGTKESISFLGSAPVVASAGGKFRYTVAVEHQQNRTDLILRAAPELADPRDASVSTKSVLLSDVAGAEFAYFGEESTERRHQWQDVWKLRADLPRLIRVKVGLSVNDVRSWPDLLIAPRILADVGCVYDPATMRCRGR